MKILFLSYPNKATRILSKHIKRKLRNEKTIKKVWADFDVRAGKFNLLNLQALTMDDEAEMKKERKCHCCLLHHEQQRVESEAWVESFGWNEGRVSVISLSLQRLFVTKLLLVDSFIACWTIYEARKLMQQWKTKAWRHLLLHPCTEWRECGASDNTLESFIFSAFIKIWRKKSHQQKDVKWDSAQHKRRIASSKIFLFKNEKKLVAMEFSVRFIEKFLRGKRRMKEKIRKKGR